MNKEVEAQIELMQVLDVSTITKSVLQKDLIDDFEHFQSANQLEEWIKMEVPSSLPECYQPNLKYSLLNKILEKHGKDRSPLTRDELLNYAIIYSGIHPVDFEARNYARLLDVYPSRHSFPFITGELNSRRTPARAIPPLFQINEQLHTPFIAQKSDDSGNTIEVKFLDYPEVFSLGKITKLLPLDSPNIIAYVRKLKGPEHKQDLSITINPLLACSEKCLFCYRQYGLIGNTDLGAREKSSLVRIQPDVMAKYISIKFRELNLNEIKHFSLVTGSFNNYNDMYIYIERFRKEMDLIIDRKTNTKSRYGITILTHLATTEEEMIGLRELGVTELQHTMEVFDDKRRVEIMPATYKNVNFIPKSAVKFDKILSMIEPGQRIFGNGFSVTSILGIDNISTTIIGLSKLKKAGLNKLSFPVYQTYNTDGLNLYNMTFPELIDARQEAKCLFIRQY